MELQGARPKWGETPNRETAMLRRFLPIAGAVLMSLAAPARAELRAETFASPGLARDINANVYVPAGDPPPNGWPVVYLLHGHDGNRTPGATWAGSNRRWTG